MNNFYKTISVLGLDKSLPKTEQARIIVLNKIAAISLIATVPTLILTIILSLPIPEIGLICAIFLVILPTLLLQKNGYYKYARYHYTIGVLIITWLIAFFNARAGKLVPSEVIIVGVSAVVPLLFDNKTRTFLFLSYGISTLVVYLFREHVISEITWYTFVGFINHALAFSSIHLFSRYYKREINQHTAEVESLLIELKKREEEILSENTIQEALIDNTPVLLALVDVEGYYITVNKVYEESIKISKDKLIGTHFSKVLPPKFIEFHLPKFQKAVEGNVVEFEEDFKELGTHLCMMGKYYPVFDESNREVKYISIFKIDITKQKSAEAALKKINKTKDKLFSIIAHDLVGPIHNLDDILYLNEIDQISEQDLAKYNANVRQRLGVIKHMMFNLLSWAKRQFKGEQDAKQVISVADLVEETIELYKDSISKKNVTVEVIIPDDLRCAMDQNHFEVVIRNLVSNAIKYSHEKGRIIVELVKEGQYKLLKIKDQGIGIPPEKLVNIRNQDNLYSNKGTQGEEGIGLGLFLCFDLAKWNGWELFVDSEPGRGSEFTLKIPIKQ